MNYKNLFLQQSYNDNYENYVLSLSHSVRKPATWDYVILTASNESQAQSYREQINYRVEKGYLPKSTHYAVLPDFEGKRIGSGGATLGVMKYILGFEKNFNDLKILVIHSGGDSKRVPQYSACGKLFSPVPRALPDGRRSSLFDEFIIAMSSVPARIGSGMLVLSGDVMLLFNPLQIDYFGSGAAALSIKEDVFTGKNHGVFLRSENGLVKNFLHKQTVETLRDLGATDKKDKVNIDTGAVILGSDILNDLYTLVSTEEDFRKYVNEDVRLSFYADFVYPLAEDSTLEDFYKQTPEGDFSDALKEARTKLFAILHKYSMKLICLSPAAFLHFGTSKELLKLVCDDIADYRFLGWEKLVNTNVKNADFAVYNSYISADAKIGKGCYIENSTVEEGATVGEGTILSGVTVKGVDVPGGIILHGLKLNNGKFVVRMLGANENPKEKVWMGKELNDYLWDAPLFCAEDTMADAVKATLSGKKGEYSLKSSFNAADVTQILPWQDKLDDKVKVESLLGFIKSGVNVKDLIGYPITPRIRKYLIKIAESADFSLKIRIFYYLSVLLDDEELLIRCFDGICDKTLESALLNIGALKGKKMVLDEVETKLPVRVNWGGGWTDTPPYCMENGGKVLNAAVMLDGEKPIVVSLKKLNENKIVLASTDTGSYKEFTDISPLRSCKDPHDPFALHKAALIACGVIPREDDGQTLADVCKTIGGGLYFNTRVIHIPKGSGLGTSSILSAACVKGFFELFGEKAGDDVLSATVICMEQLMSTGGGWQDQVGGLVDGVKLITSEKGFSQDLKIEHIELPENIKKCLDERFCLIYTGQRRLARNLLRDVVGRYIGAEPDSLEALRDIGNTAILMTNALKNGDEKEFCRLLNNHWELSKKLDGGCTNTCIDQIFAAVEDLIDGKMMCGAGGGGFVQVILKKGVTKEQLSTRLYEVFADSGVEVYTCKFCF